MTREGERWRLGHRPALDGLRTFAVGLVLLSHAGVPGVHVLGGVGVTVFFTLSGFLITTLLLEERAKTGRYSFGAFYRRRALRLMPALLACIVFAVVLELLVRGYVAEPWLILTAVTYTTNFVVPTVGHWPDALLQHTWSLAVEEQFYLLWPVLLLGLVRLPRRWALLVLVYAVFFSTVLRVATYQPGKVGHSYMSLATRADELLIGVMLAIMMHGAIVRRIQGANSVVALLLAAIVVGGLLAPGLLMPTAVALLTGGVLFVAAHGRVGLLEHRWALWLGRRSYGVYLYNTPIAWALHQMAAPWWAIAPAFLVGSVLVAAASYRWVESPFLARRYSRSTTRVAGWRNRPTSRAPSRSAP